VNLSKAQGSASYVHQSSYPIHFTQPDRRFDWVRIYYAIVPDESGNYKILLEKL